MTKADCKIIGLKDKPLLKDRAAQWFHEKWGIPLSEYLESMEASLSGKSAVPQWYLAMDGGRIIGGMGVIENDFHERKDLTPNVCAVYTEEDCRGRGKNKTGRFRVPSCHFHCPSETPSRCTYILTMPDASLCCTIQRKFQPYRS